MSTFQLTHPGVTVAPGDPGQISTASVWHSDLSDGLDTHAGTVAVRRRRRGGRGMARGRRRRTRTRA